MLIREIQKFFVDRVIANTASGVRSSVDCLFWEQKVEGSIPSPRIFLAVAAVFAAIVGSRISCTSRKDSNSSDCKSDTRPCKSALVLHCLIAQLVEQSAVNRLVSGSNPDKAAIFKVRRLCGDSFCRQLGVNANWKAVSLLKRCPQGLRVRAPLTPNNYPG